ncbi:hypothetical protein J1605_023219 [Eschrichtius robustus]|uniref:Uncharacterized protein n=1 Tax=Eschrichtius robustus TaxID=9764 RepID=A0AB34H8E4_ESCRO|nr:hypothetical protein J1605_023219 [Eschrichtius robustus]
MSCSAPLSPGGAPSTSHRPSPLCSSQRVSRKQPVAPVPGRGTGLDCLPCLPCLLSSPSPTRPQPQLSAVLTPQGTAPATVLSLPCPWRTGCSSGRAAVGPPKERSNLDFFSPKPGTGACSLSDGPLLQPSAAPAGNSQAPVVPASVPAPLAGSFSFSTGLAPALAPKAEPAAPGHHGSASGDGTLRQLDALDQLLEEAKA